MFSLLKYFLFKFREKNFFNSGLIISKLNILKKKIYSLKDVEFSSYSQNGEDGIIDWLVDAIKLTEKLNFVELGCGDFRECNTRFLLKKRNWKGLLLDANIKNINQIKRDNIFWKYDLCVINEKLQKNNINKILAKNNFTKNIGVFSLDIDGNDFWILDELSYRPSIIVCEYNGVLGDKFQLTVPYDENFNRSDKHYSNLYYGASILAFIQNLKNKNYFFVGTDSRGVNAFFVERKYFSDVSKKLNNILIYAPAHRDSKDINYKSNFIGGPYQINEIKGKEVFDIKRKKKIFLKNIIHEIYSKDFLNKKFIIYRKI